jgi:hypothetical protein
MTSARKPAGFLQLNYDKILVLTALAGLLISALVLLMRLGSEAKGILPGDLEATNPIVVESFDVTPLQALADTIVRPYQVPAAQRRMLVGELRVSSIPHGYPIPFDASVCPFSGTNQPRVVRMEDRDSDGDGLPDVWETQYAFSPNDPNDALGDLDGDGFSNLEEFQANTSPADPDDYPPPSAKLRLERAMVNPFKLRFLGTSQLPNGETVYQLNLRSLERTYFARMNADVEGFTVVEYDEKAADGPTLVLKQADKIIRLVQGRVRDETSYTAMMVFLVDGKRFRSNIGESITLIDAEYKVVDIRENRVVIRDEKASRDYEIGPMTSEDRRSAPAGGL